MESNQRADNAGIVIADAVTLLASKLGDVAEARRVLVQRAQIGDLQAIASRAHGPFDGERLNERDWKIPADLWLRLGNHSDDEWRRGDLRAEQDRDSYAELLEDFGTPLRLIDVRIEAESLNRIADSLPVDWVNAHDAIEMLLSMYGKGMGLAAGISLVKRAHSGLVKSRARLFQWEERVKNPYGGSRKIQREAQFAALPSSFWWAEGHEALEQNWITGDFATWIDQTFHWQAFGTEFSRNDIAAMLPKAEDRGHAGSTQNPHLYLHKAEENVSSLPSEEAIEAKMQDLVGMGIKRDVAAMVIRQISGFEAVGNEHARRTVAGKLPRGRPKKETA